MDKPLSNPLWCLWHLLESYQKRQFLWLVLGIITFKKFFLYYFNLYYSKGQHSCFPYKVYDNNIYWLPVWPCTWHFTHIVQFNHETGLHIRDYSIHFTNKETETQSCGTLSYTVIIWQSWDSNIGSKVHWEKEVMIPWFGTYTECRA